MKTTAQRVKLIRRLIREVNTWCAAPTADEVHSIAKRGLEEELANDAPNAALSATVDLDGLAGWHGYFGAKAILEGDSGGWQRLEYTLQYEWWCLRIAGSVLIHQWNKCLAHAIVNDDVPKARWLAARMPRGLADKSILGWDFSHFAPFLLHLWALRTKAAPPPLEKATAGLGPYRAILDAWQDGPALTIALGNACDYHLDHATYSAADKEFLDAPYLLFPVDILAIARVREHLGLPMPEIYHPLMQTPLAKPPPPDERPRMPPDPLLDAVIAKARAQGFLPPVGGDDFAI